MKDLISKLLINQVEKKQNINNFDAKNHSILTFDYEKLCINFFSDKYNSLDAILLAEQTLPASLESEAVYVNWLNKEWYV